MSLPLAPLSANVTVFVSIVKKFVEFWLVVDRALSMAVAVEMLILELLLEKTPNRSIFRSGNFLGHDIMLRYHMNELT